YRPRRAARAPRRPRPVQRRTVPHRRLGRPARRLGRPAPSAGPPRTVGCAVPLAWDCAPEHLLAGCSDSLRRAVEGTAPASTLLACAAQVHTAPRASRAILPELPTPFLPGGGLSRFGVGCVVCRTLFLQ